VDDETIERALGAQLTRRRFIQLGGLAGVAVLVSPVLAACSAGTTASAGAASSQAAGAAASKLTGSLVVNIESGTIADAVKNAWLNPFAKSTGVNCIADETDPDLAKLTAMIESGQPPTLDMYVFAPNGIVATDYPKYFEPIDYTLINKDLFYPGFFGDEWIASSIDSYVLGYNTKSTGGKAPTGWADLFDLQGFAGKRGFEDRWETSCMIALMADGVAPDKLIPIDVDRALGRRHSQ
jgi:putative spermidine/putrescine transport system substrate-binding protein